MVVKYFSNVIILFGLNKRIFFMQDEENRLIDIEMALTENERQIEDLNQVIISQGKQIDRLVKQVQYLFSQLNQDTVKPQNEETPPPHY